MQHGWLAATVLGILLGAGLPGSTHPAAPADAQRVSIGKSKPEYWKDSRLEKSVAFPDNRPVLPPGEGVLTQPLPPNEAEGPDAPPRVVRLVAGRVIDARAFLDEVKSKTGVSLYLAGDWGRESLALPQAGSPVRELMDSMARLYKARWYPTTRDAWVLAQNQREVEFVSMPEPKRDQEIKASIRATFATLAQSPGQWQALARGESLSLQMLTPPQREAILQNIRLYYYDPTLGGQNAPTARTTTGDGVTISLSGRGKDAMLNINGPGRTGRFFCGTPFYNDDGTPAWGVLPPR